jgi:hypothetical protein
MKRGTVLAHPTQNSYPADWRAAVERARAINALPSELGAAGTPHTCRIPVGRAFHRAEEPAFQ